MHTFRNGRMHPFRNGRMHPYTLCSTMYRVPSTYVGRNDGSHPLRFMFSYSFGQNHVCSVTRSCTDLCSRLYGLRTVERQHDAYAIPYEYVRYIGTVATGSHHRHVTCNVLHGTRTASTQSCTRAIVVCRRVSRLLTCTTFCGRTYVRRAGVRILVKYHVYVAFIVLFVY